MAETTDEQAPAVALDPFTAELAGHGFAIADGYPANHRLRAEALAKAGKDADPAGHITSDLIAATKDRLEAEAADAKAAEAAENDAATAEARRLRSMKVDDLRQLAANEQVAVEGDANKSTIVDAIEAARAARNEG